MRYSDNGSGITGDSLDLLREHRSTGTSASSPAGSVPEGRGRYPS